MRHDAIQKSYRAIQKGYRLNCVILLGASMVVLGAVGTVHGFGGGFGAIRGREINTLPQQRQLLQETARALQEKDWSAAAGSLVRLRQFNNKSMKNTLDRLDKTVKDQANSALTKASRQFKNGMLVPAVETARLAERLDPRFGVKKRSQEAIAQMEKHELYGIALAKVMKLERDKAKARPRPALNQDRIVDPFAKF